MTDSKAGTMKMVGGDPCIDFVNTVGGRVAPDGGGDIPRVVRNDKLETYEDLVAWARHAALLDGQAARALRRRASRRPREASRVLSRAVAGREALHGVFSALMAGQSPATEDLDQLNADLLAVRSRERLVPAGDGLRWDATGPELRLDSVLWPVWRRAERVLTSGDLVRLRRCGGDGCGWLFLDHSRNHRRRWCTMEDCGNVSKVRRFRSRLRRGSAGPRPGTG